MQAVISTATLAAGPTGVFASVPSRPNTRPSDAKHTSACWWVAGLCSARSAREEPLGVAQKGASAFHAPKMLERGQRQDLRVREPFEGPVATPSVRVETGVGIINETERYRDILFQ